MSEHQRRIRRSNEELIAEVEKQIAVKKQQLEKLEAKKARLLAGKSKARSLGRTGLIKKAIEQGMSVEEIRDKLGL